MTLIKTAAHCGLVLEPARDVAKGAPPAKAGSASEPIGHFILLNRYRVDDEGYICLSSALPLSALESSVDVLAAELRNLLEQARRRFPLASEAN